MSIQSIPTFALPRLPSQISAGPTVTGGVAFEITALNSYVAYVCRMPSTGAVDSVFFRVFSAQCQGPVTVEVSFESVTASGPAPGTPTGFPLSAAAAKSVAVSNNANPADYEVRFSSPINIDRGQLLSIVLAVTAGTLTGTGLRFANFSDDNVGTSFPYCLDSTGSTVGIVNDDVAPGLGIGLSAVSAVPLQFCWPMNAAPSTLSFNASAMHGNRITVDSKIRVCGATVWGDAALANAAINLYDSNGALLVTGDWNYNIPNDTTSREHNIIFPTAVTLTPGTYYLGVSGGRSGTSTTVTMYYASFASSFWRMASPMGGTSVMYISSNTSNGFSGAWSEIATRQTFIGLLVDGVDDGTGDAGASGGETSSVFFA
jgi:hypothetical protein